MNVPLYVTPPAPIQLPELSSLTSHEVTDLLRQSLDAQREQVGIMKAQQAAQDSVARHRAFLGRWAGEFPDIGGACRTVLPHLERAYLAMIKDLSDRLQDEDAGDLQDEFVLNEFLDKYGIRLAQLGNILSQIGPLADAAPPDNAGTPPAV